MTVEKDIDGLLSDMDPRRFGKHVRPVVGGVGGKCGIFNRVTAGLAMRDKCLIELNAGCPVPMTDIDAKCE